MTSSNVGTSIVKNLRVPFSLYYLLLKQFILGKVTKINCRLHFTCYAIQHFQKHRNKSEIRWFDFILFGEQHRSLQTYDAYEFVYVLRLKIFDEIYTIVVLMNYLHLRRGVHWIHRTYYVFKQGHLYPTSSPHSSIFVRTCSSNGVSSPALSCSSGDICVSIANQD